jgi:hypothetical protein
MVDLALEPAAEPGGLPLQVVEEGQERLEDLAFGGRVERAAICALKRVHMLRRSCTSSS